jgi:hypothetical protein
MSLQGTIDGIVNKRISRFFETSKFLSILRVRKFPVKRVWTVVKFLDFSSHISHEEGEPNNE